MTKPKDTLSLTSLKKGFSHLNNEELSHIVKGYSDFSAEDQADLFEVTYENLMFVLCSLCSDGLNAVEREVVVLRKLVELDFVGDRLVELATVLDYKVSYLALLVIGSTHDSKQRLNKNKLFNNFLSIFDRDSAALMPYLYESESHDMFVNVWKGLMDEDSKLIHPFVPTRLSYLREVLNSDLNTYHGFKIATFSLDADESMNAWALMGQLNAMNTTDSDKGWLFGCIENSIHDANMTELLLKSQRFVVRECLKRSLYLGADMKRLATALDTTSRLLYLTPTMLGVLWMGCAKNEERFVSILAYTMHISDSEERKDRQFVCEFYSAIQRALHTGSFVRKEDLDSLMGKLPMQLSEILVSLNVIINHYEETSSSARVN